MRLITGVVQAFLGCASVPERSSPWDGDSSHGWRFATQLGTGLCLSFSLNERHKPVPSCVANRHPCDESPSQGLERSGTDAQPKKAWTTPVIRRIDLEPRDQRPDPKGSISIEAKPGS